MKFFKKIIEINNLAKGFNGTYVMINELEVKINNHLTTDYSEFEEDLFILAYLCRNAIIDRMEEYNWSITAPIIVPMMSKGYITILFAYQQTIGRLYNLAEKVSVSNIIKEILDKEEAYLIIDRSIPKHIKAMFN